MSNKAILKKRLFPVCGQVKVFLRVTWPAFFYSWLWQYYASCDFCLKNIFKCFKIIKKIQYCSILHIVFENKIKNIYKPMMWFLKINNNKSTKDSTWFRTRAGRKLKSLEFRKINTCFVNDISTMCWGLFFLFLIFTTSCLFVFFFIFFFFLLFIIIVNFLATFTSRFFFYILKR